jgi:hypothetical protein
MIDKKICDASFPVGHPLNAAGVLLEGHEMDFVLVKNGDYRRGCISTEVLTVLEQVEVPGLCSADSERVLD